MENTQTLPYLGHQITEQEYRNLPMFSYSVLSDFIKKGHSVLYEKKEDLSQAGVRKGNILDSMITSGDLHPKNIIILDSDKLPSATIINIIKYFINFSKELPVDLYNCTDSQKGTLLAAALNEEYGQSWKSDTILDKIRAAGNEYYKVLLESVGIEHAVITSIEEFEKACDAYRTLLESKYVSKYLVPENSEDVIVMYDQVKLTHPSLCLKGMLDRVKINYTKKTITPIDFKNIGFEERDFGRTNYISFNYDIQATLYRDLLVEYVKGIPEFQDFVVEDFVFVVINLNNLTPLAFISPSYESDQPLYFKNSLNKRLTWLEIYNEVLKYDLNDYSPYSLTERELQGEIKLDMFIQNPQLQC